MREPPDILITTPESLYLMLTSRAREILRTVETVIVDEIHSLVGNQARRPPVRVAGATGGAAARRPDRPTHCSESDFRRRSDRWRKWPACWAARNGPAKHEPHAHAPAGRDRRGGSGQAAGSADRSAGRGHGTTGQRPVDDGPSRGGTGRCLRSGRRSTRGWCELIRQHRSTMIFVNSRRLAERLAAAINELAEEEIALAHHGSIAKDTRLQIEDRLKRGQLPAIVATSSLELGIDMGAVDLVIQIEAPPSIASGIQRIGRSGHQVGAPSKGIIFPKYRGDLLACSAAAERMMRGRGRTDVLSAQSAGCAGSADWWRWLPWRPVAVDELYATVRRAAPFHDLPRSSFEGVLDLLAGRYPSDEFSELRPRINWDRVAGTVSPRRGSQRLAILNAGTIPDRGLYGVYLADGRGQPQPRGRTGRRDGLRDAARRRLPAGRLVLARGRDHARIACWSLRHRASRARCPSGEATVPVGRWSSVGPSVG